MEEHNKQSAEDCTLPKAVEFMLSNFQETIKAKFKPYVSESILEAMKACIEGGYRIAKKHSKLLAKQYNIDDLTERYIQSMADVSLDTERDFKAGYHTGYTIGQSRLTELEEENKRLTEALEGIRAVKSFGRTFEIAEQALKQKI